MARRKNPRLSKEEKRRQRERREAQTQEDVVHDTAARFTCAAETADDFAYQCTHAQEALDIDLLFHRMTRRLPLAAAICKWWPCSPERIGSLVAVLHA